MRLLENLTADRRKLLAVVLAILAVAAFLRFFNINWSFSNNGVDEGIMLERARMVSSGHELYSELPCDQAPLVFMVGALFQGDVLPLRALTASLSMVAIVCCMVAARRLQGNTAMIFTGLLLAVDFPLLRESRLFSLDGMSTFFLAMALPLYLHYIERGSRVSLALAGLLLGASTGSKLFGGVALAGALVFMTAEWWMARKVDRSTVRTAADASILVVAAAAPVVVLLLVLGPSEMLNGMVFDQGHRQSDLGMKLSILVFFGLNLAYALPLVHARRVWARSKGERFLLILTAVLLVNFVLQPLVFLHHLVIMSPGLAVLGGVFIARAVENRKEHNDTDKTETSSEKGISRSKAIFAVSMLGVLVSAGLGSYGLAMQGTPGQLSYAEKISEWTSQGDWIICGDPLVTSYAERLTPPDMVNVGTRVYPVLTIDDVEAAIIEHEVAVFILSYRFLQDDMDGLGQFLVDNGYEKVDEQYMGEWTPSAFAHFEDTLAPAVFVRGDVADEFGLPTETWSP